MHITPAVNHHAPVPGEHVRTSHCPVGSQFRTDHRDIAIESAGVHPEYGPYVCTVCETSEGVVKSTTYADREGRYPQFLPVAPNGPYADEKQQEHWRAGYHDALEFVALSERYIQPSAEYLAGAAAGRQLREALGLKPYRPQETPIEPGTGSFILGFSQSKSKPKHQAKGTKNRRPVGTRYLKEAA